MKRYKRKSYWQKLLERDYWIDEYGNRHKLQEFDVCKSQFRPKTNVKPDSEALAQLEDIDIEDCWE